MICKIDFSLASSAFGSHQLATFCLFMAAALGCDEKIEENIWQNKKKVITLHPKR